MVGRSSVCVHTSRSLGGHANAKQQGRLVRVVAMLVWAVGWRQETQTSLLDSCKGADACPRTAQAYEQARIHTAHTQTRHATIALVTKGTKHSLLGAASLKLVDRERT
eukprot:1262712-Prymnesium_polylepis.3